MVCASPVVSFAQTMDWTVASDTAAQRFGQPNADITTRSVVHGDETWTVRTVSVLDSPLALSRPDTRNPTTHVEWHQDWEAFNETTPSGIEVSLTPRAGLGFGRGGTTAMAGATLKLGRGIEDMAPDGDEAFGDKPRWYIFASGSRRAVGYNLTRGTDGALHREGLSQDVGHTLGDAAIGVAWRRGPVQSSVGIAYREVE
ncbi:lipid A-modifier LpxR family protein, partial [uncultured Brevundimonas sp.]|uniref:lipid A-modifier LpxR family protein n=1 Tax=uncultured Brevundimonas sp. TaxID=213418 RepID=UPI002626A9FB